jgi:hypothetical protein
MIVDREGMATAFLASLHAEGRHVVAILQTNQYWDLSSFSDVGAFVPQEPGISTDRSPVKWLPLASVCPVKTILTNPCARPGSPHP